VRGRLAALVGGATLLLAACGGGGAGSSESPSSPTEFRQQADAICAKYESKIEALPAPTSLDDLQGFVDEVIPLIEQGNAELGDLEPPEELADDWGRALELQEENLQKARELQGAIRDKDDARVQQLFTELGETEDESNRIARSIGLEKCGGANS
jgi:hypothetical protein